MSFWQKWSNSVKRQDKKMPLWLAGLLLGVIFLAIGFYGDQFAAFYRKAVMICLECIGIG